MLGTDVNDVQFAVLGKKTTVCILTLENGFEITGTSSCVDPKDFDKEIGETYALKQAREKAEEFEGFLRQQYKWRGFNEGESYFIRHERYEELLEYEDEHFNIEWNNKVVIPRERYEVLIGKEEALDLLDEECDCDICDNSCETVAKPFDFQAFDKITDEHTLQKLADDIAGMFDETLLKEVVETSEREQQVRTLYGQELLSKIIKDEQDKRLVLLDEIWDGLASGRPREELLVLAQEAEHIQKYLKELKNHD